MSLLRHKNVVNLLDVMSDSKNFYLVIELCKGGAFFAKVNDNKRRRRRFDNEVAKSCFRQLLAGLEHCHQQGIVHRDLKLENILLDDEGNLKLCDFGLSTKVEENDSTIKGFCGTRKYMAPEVFNWMNNRQPYDGFASDIYSLGVLLYVTLACDYPFKPNLEKDPNFKLMGTGEFPFPKDLMKRYLGANELLERMMDPDPKNRATFDEIKEHPWMRFTHDEMVQYIDGTLDESTISSSKEAGESGEQNDEEAAEGEEGSEKQMQQMSVGSASGEVKRGVSGSTGSSMQPVSTAVRQSGSSSSSSNVSQASSSGDGDTEEQDFTVTGFQQKKGITMDGDVGVEIQVDENGNLVFEDEEVMFRGMPREIVVEVEEGDKPSANDYGIIEFDDDEIAYRGLPSNLESSLGSELHSAGLVELVSYRDHVDNQNVVYSKNSAVDLFEAVVLQLEDLKTSKSGVTYELNKNAYELTYVEAGDDVRTDTDDEHVEDRDEAIKATIQIFKGDNDSRVLMGRHDGGDAFDYCNFFYSIVDKLENDGLVEPVEIEEGDDIVEDGELDVEVVFEDDE
eukprot:TRINITY_DN185_c0_g1_i3.p1 TRINITY_DN185_c0_g1~~TRINITY_DN185_c0_g1_i3.p1  ORF type:complete len:640 (+),score=277.47 TRINITY_DN185_c0_g1_i3:227-1921(+)